MCGITGIRDFDGRTVEPAVLSAMAGRLAHRGPDDDGIWIGPGVGLGHRRLSIIDLGGSAQPMSSADGRWHMVFNGEILNYQALRNRIDYAWRTGGDTEVILALLACEGHAALNLLEGQFTFAAYDAQERVLWLVRDRLGILPLYYLREGERLLFASEPKAIVAGLGRSPEVDLDQLDTYLGRRYVPAPFTLLKGLRKVEPGHWVRIDSRGAVTTGAYWALPDEREQLALDDAGAVVRVEQTLKAAIGRNLVADVPVGTYLSGGLDSSLITALVAEARGGGDGLNTFSAGFDDPRVDELHYAELVARHLGTSHHPVVVRPDDFVATWHRLSWHRDAPLSEPADIAVARLAEAAHQEVKVVLSGEGADELFAGYPKYRLARAGRLAERVPASVRAPLLERVATHLPSRARRFRVALRALAAPTTQDRLATWFAPFTASQRAELLGRPVARADRQNAARMPSTPDAPRRHTDAIREMGVYDLDGWLADNLLERGDRMTMAASVELRPPFLDREVVELAFRLPSSMKLRGSTGKWVLRQIAAARLPEPVITRPKSGFRVPIDAWFKGGLREMANDLLRGEGSFVGSTLAPAAVERLLDDHASGRSDEAIAIWTLLSLEVWHDVFFKSRHG